MPELDRRDVLKALGAAGITVAGGGAVLEWSRETDRRLATTGQRRTLYALADTVYPSNVTGIESFVDGYMSRRLQDDRERFRGVADAIVALDEHARAEADGEFRTLDPDTRDETLRSMGVDTADPDPDGEPPARVRYYLVNELLYGFYSSPTGGRLVGLENPQGHPGGIGSYQQPPE